MTLVGIFEAVGATVLAITDWEWSIGLRSGQPHLVYDAVRGWKLRKAFASDDLNTNSHGFRGPEVADANRTAMFRIVALGDSVTFGTYDCPSGQCPDDQTYPVQLEAALRTPDGPRFEVINAGTEGYKSVQALAWLRDDIVAYRPNLILVLVGWNDLLESGRPPVPSSFIDRVVGLRGVDDFLRRQSHGYRAIWYGLNWARRGQHEPIESPDKRPEPPSGVSVNPSAIADYESNLRSIARKAHESGARVVFLTLASALDGDTNLSAEIVSAIRRRYQWANLERLAEEIRRYNSVVREVAASEGADAIDLETVVRAAGAPPVFRAPDIHHSSHDALARLCAGLARELRTRGLAPG
jgi:lysophospholipase L1-like esterase